MVYLMMKATLAYLHSNTNTTMLYLLLYFCPHISEEDSVFDESDIHDTPTGAGNKESQTFFARLKRIGGSKSVKYQPVELNAKKSKKPGPTKSSPPL